MAILEVIRVEEDNENDVELPEIPASEVLDKIQRGEPVEYAFVIIKGDLDFNKITMPKEEDKFLVYSSLRIINSKIKGAVNFANTIFKII